MDRNQSSPLLVNTKEAHTSKSSMYPFLERLQQQKQITPTEFDFAVEIKNIFVKIPLLQDVKYIPIYTKIVRDLCIQKIGIPKGKPPTIQVIGRIASLMFS